MQIMKVPRKLTNSLKSGTNNLTKKCILRVGLVSPLLFFYEGDIMIEFINCYKEYPNGTKALNNVNLQIEQGEMVAVIGLSGAGKSTLIRLVNRMIPVTSGQCIVDGTDVMKLNNKQLRQFRRKIGMVFQSFNLVNRVSVIKNVLAARVAEMNFFQTVFGLYKKEDKILALESLDRVGILEKAYQRADQLSGGQQQRVALARCLAQKPKIILADEPVAALDPVTANMVMEDFVKINQEMNITVIINIHHVDIALKYCDRIIGVRAGEIVFDGPSESVTDETLQLIYGRQLTADEVMEDTHVSI